MFKPRSAATPPQPPSIELVRQRAKHRLIGVAVLVLAAVVVLPLLFDSQPRPIPVDVAIEIPSRHAVKPLVVAPVETPKPQQSVDSGEAASKPAGADLVEEIIPPLPAAAEASAKAPSPSVSPPVTAGSTAVAAAAAKPNPSTTPSQTPRAAEPKPAKPLEDRASDAARAQALLEGKAAPVTPKVTGDDASRFIVQVGAFADPALAQQARQKLERAGLKTYTHVAQTADGKRVRVRLGPFAKRGDAEKAAAKAKTLGMPAAILTL
jgi:DedD protein